MDSVNGSVSGNETLAIDDGLSVASIVVIVIDVVLIVIICGGNLMTLLAVWLTPALRTVPNMYIVSLAVADLLAGLVIPYQMIIFFPGMRDALNDNMYLCLFRYSLFFVSASESLFCLMIISLDRWIYIAKPLHYVNMVTPLRAGLAIAATWCAAVLYGAVPLYDNNWTETTQCRLFSVLTFKFQVYGQGGSYLFFCVICIIAYYNIFKIAYKQRRIIEDMSNTGNQRHKLKKAKRDWQLIKLFFLVFGIFFLCWTPTFVCLAVGHTVGLPYIVMDIVGPISVLNSGMNFFIYAFKNKDFRQAFRHMLCGKQRSSSSVTNIDSSYHTRGRRTDLAVSSNRVSPVCHGKTVVAVAPFNNQEGPDPAVAPSNNQECPDPAVAPSNNQECRDPAVVPSNNQGRPNSTEVPSYRGRNLNLAIVPTVETNER